MVSVEGVGKVESRINIVQKIKGVEGLVRVYMREGRGAISSIRLFVEYNCRRNRLRCVAKTHVHAPCIIN